MKDILETIIFHLVEEKNEVKISEIINPDNEKYITYEVKVSEKDMGRVIGKQGRIAKSIRTVMNSVATKERKKVNIEFVD